MMSKSRRSKMWQNFDKVMITGYWLAKCKVHNCGSNKQPEKFLELPDSCTTHLWRHLDNFHPELAAVAVDRHAQKKHQKQQRKRELREFYWKNLKNMMQHDALPFRAAISTWMRRLVKDIAKRITMKDRKT